MSSDEQIQREIWESLRQYGQFDSSWIKIEVDNGHVTLSGLVDNRRARHLAQGATMRVPGVRDIQNQLELKPAQTESLEGSNKLENAEDHRRETAIDSDYPGYDPRWVDIYSAPESTFSEFQEVSPGAGPNSTDLDEPVDPTKRIAEEIYERLRQNGHIKADDIKVAINGGQVTLNGTIDSHRAKEVADEIASSVEGVSQILNQLQVK